MEQDGKMKLVALLGAVLMAVLAYTYFTNNTLLVVLSPAPVSYRLYQTLPGEVREDSKLIRQGTIPNVLICLVRTEEYYWLRTTSEESEWNYVFLGSWPVVIKILRSS